MLKTNIEKIYKFYQKYPEYIGKIKVETRFGYHTINDCFLSAKNSDVYEIITKSNKVIKASPDHRLLSNESKWQFVKNLKIGDFLFSKTNIEVIKSIKKLNYKEDLYDLTVDVVNEFYANDIVSHNSSSTDALFFALSGKPYRNIKKNQLINSKNGKDCVVELSFSKGKTNYKVVRGIKPNIFEIYKNDELINEDSNIRDYQQTLEEIIGCDPSVFKHTIIMSSRFYTPFLELPAYQKRDFIENILSIKIFSTINDIIKKKNSSLKQELFEVGKDIEKIESNIKILNEYSDKRVQEIESRKIEILNEIDIKESEKVSIKDNINELEESHSSNYDVIVSLQDKLTKEDKIKTKIQKIKISINDIKSKIAFFTDNNSCPTCSQEISDKTKNKNIEDLSSDISTYYDQYNTYNNAYEKIKKISEKLEMLTTQNREIHKNMLILGNQIDHISSDIINLQKEMNKLNNPVNNEDSKIEELNNSIKDLKIKHAKIEKKTEYMKNITDIISEKGIKKFILNKYIPILNKLINEYLELLDSTYQILFDEELNETIIARGYSNLGYGNFSAGEKQRVDVAMLFAFLEISRLKNSVQTNVLMLDEILDASLDENGISGIFKIFDKLKQRGYTIYIISHRPGISSYFDNVYNVTKNIFSEMIKED